MSMKQINKPDDNRSIQEIIRKIIDDQPDDNRPIAIQ